MSKYACADSMAAVLGRCEAAFRDISGQDLLFSRDFTAEEFKQRRQTIAAKIGPDAHLLIPGAPLQMSHLASQDATFYYFTGLDVLQSMLLVDGSGHSTLYMPSRDAMDGEPADKLGFEEAEMVRQRLLFDAVKPLEALDADIAQVKTLYLPFAGFEGGGVTRFQANGCERERQANPWDAEEPRHARIRRRVESLAPGVEVIDASTFIGQMRRVKSAAEIEVLRQAGHLSALIMIESMKATRAGMCESRLEAIAKYIYSAFGNCDLGYGVIAASGVRIENGHYHFNNGTVRDGEVILMDCGPDLRHYSSDIARIWPVNGTFSPWHRRVCGLIAAYHKVLISLIRPGVSPPEMYVEAAAIMRHGCKTNRFPCGDMTELVELMIAKGTRYYNHCVGLSVHDFVGPWREDTIEEGMVFVVDPMWMFRDRHQYIRVEDTIVVTHDGCERLTGAAPIELDEIEALMREPGALDPDRLAIL